LNWVERLRYNPLNSLLKIDDKLIQYHIKRDLLEKSVDSVHQLWKNKRAEKILNSQQDNGAWPDKNKKRHKNIATNYQLVETYRYVSQLITFFDFDKSHPSMKKAAEFFFSEQTKEGDFRGIYGNQYSPNYSAAILELLCRLGYHKDKRIIDSFEWLLSIEQEKGGWIIPIEMPQVEKKPVELYTMDLIKPNKSLPHSHMVSGIVIRAFSQHPKYREHPSAKRCGNLLAKRFCKRDKYPSRRAPEYWIKFSYPFWWTDLISVLDALSYLKITTKNRGIKKALNYFIKTQNSDGSWEPYILKSKSFPNLKWWINYHICLMFRRFYEED
jgi:hypothetical protein